MTFECSNPDCNIAATGVCIDGFDPVTDCPNLIDKETDVNESIVTEKDIVKHFETSKPKQTVEAHFNVSAGTVLNLRDATNLLRKYNSKVIACVGQSEVGKTTLLASIYEYISNTIGESHIFAGSKTLYSFEQICHLSRAKSGSMKADTLRTPTTGHATFYHLAFDHSGGRKDILLADRAGEEYMDVLDDSTTCKNLYEIKRSDALLLLIDSNQLAGTDRHAAKRNVKKMIQLLSSENMFLEGLKLILVMTRYDKVSIESREVADFTFQSVFEDVNKILIGKGISVVKHIVAARPDSLDEFEAGFGVKELLSIILEPVVTSESSFSHIYDHSTSRIFNQLKGF